MAIGCGVHTGAISSSVHTFGVPSLITTVVCCVIIVLVILGGLGALVKVTDKLVPAMAIIYMAAGTLLIILNIQNLIPADLRLYKCIYRDSGNRRICRGCAGGNDQKRLFQRCVLE